MELLERRKIQWDGVHSTAPVEFFIDVPDVRGARQDADLHRTWRFRSRAE
jgi:hypothetical protein